MTKGKRLPGKKALKGCERIGLVGFCFALCRKKGRRVLEQNV